MRRILSDTLQSQGLQLSLLSSFGGVTAAIFSGVSLILFSRVLGPTEFGVFSSIYALSLLVVRLADAGLNTSMLKLVGNETELNSLSRFISSATLLRLFFGAVALGLLLITVPTLLPVFGLSNITSHFLLLTVISSVCLILYEQVLVSLQALRLVAKATFVQVLQAVLKLLFAGMFVLMASQDGSIAFVGFAITPLIPALGWRLLVPRYIKLQWYGLEQERAQLLAIIRHSWLNSVSMAVNDNIGILLAYSFLNAYEAGVLGAVSKISLVVMVVANAISRVLYPRVSQYSTSVARVLYLWKASAFSTISLLSIMLFVPIAHLSIQFTIGAAYLSGLPVLLLMMLSSLVYLATIPFTALLYGARKNWYFFVVGSLQIGVVVFGNMLFVPKYGLVASALTAVIAQASVFILTLTFAWLVVEKESSSRESLKSL